MLSPNGCIGEVFVLHGEMVDGVAQLLGERGPADAPLSGHQRRLYAVDR
jgi:hypothetical protein